VLHFAHQFRQLTNMSPHQYMLQLSIEREKGFCRKLYAAGAWVMIAGNETGE
jgi:hypothetical protein